MWRRIRWAAIVALAAGVLIHKLGAKDIWLDEAASWQTASMPVSALIAETAQDIHPPLYYLVLKGWMQLWGDSLVALRSFSVVCGVVSLWLMFELGAALRLREGVLCAAVAWCAVSPHTVFYDQEARMYPLLTALVLGASLAYRRWIDSEGTSRRWLVSYVLCATAALYVHYFASLIIVALSCHALVWGRRARTGEGVTPRSGWTWIGANSVVVAAYAAWIPVAIAQVVHDQARRAPVGIVDLPREASRYVRELLFGHLEMPHIWSLTCVVLVTLLTIGVSGALLRARRDRDERASFLALLAIVPSAVALAVLPLAGHLELPRYLAYALPLVILTAAYGFTAWRLPTRTVIAALLVGAMTPFSYLTGYYAASATDYDARPLVRYLTGTLGQRDAAGEFVYVAPGYVADLLRYRTRDSINYVRIHKPATFDEIVTATTAGREPSWLVVDYRSPAMDAIGADPRFVRVNMASNASDRIRLYRWVGGN
jgi:uncharacterized membrane protein